MQERTMYNFSCWEILMLKSRYFMFMIGDTEIYTIHSAI